MIQLLTCQDPFAPEVDEPFAAEAEAAARRGWSIALLDHDAIEAGEVALRGVAPALTVYRGWMMRSEAYAALAEALAARGAAMLSAPAQYQRAHEASGWLAGLRPWSLDAELFDPHDPELPARLAARFGDAPVTIKDEVKSCKHLWEEACFIPRASDAEAVARVTGRFLEERGADLTGRLLVRGFERLVEERRAFVVGGAWLSARAASGAAPIEVPEALRAAVAGLDLRFASLDLGHTEAGELRLIELGDGQVSSFVSDEQRDEVFQALGRWGAQA